MTDADADAELRCLQYLIDARIHIDRLIADYQYDDHPTRLTRIDIAKGKLIEAEEALEDNGH